MRHILRGCLLLVAALVFPWFASAQTSTSALTLAPATAVVNQTVTATVQVFGFSFSPVGGNTEVRDSGGTVLCTVSTYVTVVLGAGVLGQGQCTFTAPAASATPYPLTASYLGNANLTGSVSTPVSLTVGRATTSVFTTTITPSQGLVDLPATISVALNVTAPGAGAPIAPTGVVVVTASTGESCTFNSATGTNCVITFATVGSRTLVASYSGDTNFLPATQINPAPYFVDGPALNVTPTSLNFPDTPVNTTSAPLTVTIQNPGMAISINGPLVPVNSAFAITASTCPFAAGIAVLSAGDSCTVSIAFSPTATGLATGRLIVSEVSTFPIPRLNIPLAGTGTRVDLALTSQFTAPSIVTGGTSVYTLQIINPDPRALVNLSATIALDPDLLENLAAATTTCGGTLTGGSGTRVLAGGALAANASCVIQLQFTSSVVGTHTNTVAIGDVRADVVATPTNIPGGATNPTASSANLVVSAPAPGITVNPSPVNFGNVVVGSTSDINVTVTSSGTLPLFVSIVGAGPAPFSTVGDTCSGNSIAVGATCIITVRFAPTTLGTATGTLNIATNVGGGSTTTVALTGTGVAVPVPGLSITPGALNFGSVGVGLSSVAQTARIASTGSAPLTLTSITATGDFSLVNPCPASLAANTFCDVLLTFNPVALGARTGLLTVVSNAGTQTATLTGTGNAPPAGTLQITPPILNFGSQGAGVTTGPLLVTVINTGTVPVVLLNARTNTSAFAIASTTCGATLAGGASCTYGITFRGVFGGVYTGTFEVITSNALPDVYRVALLASVPVPAAGTLAANPNPVDFGEVMAGSSATSRTIDVSNTGSTSVIISGVTLSGANAADFTQTNNCATLAPNERCTITVTFAATVLGARTGIVTVQSNATNPSLSVTLTATSVLAPTPVIAISPTELGFGNRLVGLPTASRAVTIENRGSLPLVVGTVTALGDFVLSGNCANVTLNTGQTCELSVTFIASIVGNRSGTLRIESNAPGGARSVSVAGRGCRPFSPSGSRTQLTTCGN